MADRVGEAARRTEETSLSVRVGLDGTGASELGFGVPFLEHMLAQTARHGLLDLRISGSGDWQIDAHHTVEDAGICLGQALAQAVGDKRGLVRYGSAYTPLDEALSRVVVDLSGRPGLVYNVAFPRNHIGSFDTELVAEFLQGLVNHAWLTLHVDNLRGENAHHIAESVFKALGRALREACAIDERRAGAMPSTKGSL